jgi:hypothetical protein
MVTMYTSCVPRTACCTKTRSKQASLILIIFDSVQEAAQQNLPKIGSEKLSGHTHSTRTKNIRGQKLRRPSISPTVKYSGYTPTLTAAVVNVNRTPSRWHGTAAHWSRAYHTVPELAHLTGLPWSAHLWKDRKLLNWGAPWY